MGEDPNMFHQVPARLPLASQQGTLSRADRDTLHFAAWNIGGMSPEATLDFLSGFRGEKSLACLCIVFLQEITTQGGPHFLDNETWMLIHGKQQSGWRGCGVAYRKTLGVHQNSHLRLAACTTCLKFHNHKAIGLISGHISHKFTIAETAAALQQWGETPACAEAKVLLGLDANETFLQPGGLLEMETLSCTGRGEQILMWCTEQAICLPPQDCETPSHFPYNPELSPRRLDYVASKNLTIQQATVGSYRDRARSDHEPILAAALLPSPPGPKGKVIWCARQLKADCHEVLAAAAPKHADDHHAIAAVAQLISEPVHRSMKFQESRALKALRKAAKGAPPGPSAREAWKQVSKALQRERKEWQRKLADQAGAMNWNSYRAIKAKASRTNWAEQLLDSDSWEDDLRKHMTTIFAKRSENTTREAMQRMREECTRMCKHQAWRPFTEAEMRITMSKWKRHKATGTDGIALEALQLLFEDPRWQPRIAELLNDSLYRGDMPPWVTEGASVLLPKTAVPQGWSDTRPITLSSAILKWIAQLLLLRGTPALLECCQHQWASRHKQGVELILAMRKLARVSHEWRTPFYVVKIDIAKAFDSIAQEKLGDLVMRKIANRGDMPWEARLWLRLLEARSLNFYVQKHKVTVEQTNGVRQGSPDSPVLFAAAIGETLDAVLGQVRGGRPPHVGRHGALEPPPHSGAAFMDDTYVWGESPEYVQEVLTALEEAFLELGLRINAKKTHVVSTIADDPFRFRIGGVQVAPDGPDSILTILGAPVTLSGAIAPLVAEMQRRARCAFHANRKLLCSRAPVADRLKMHQTLVRSAALWGCPAWPPQAALLQAANTTQLLQARAMICGGRTPTETWQDWHIRSLRKTRAVLHQNKVMRWSTHSLQMQWQLWGHIGRASFAPTFHILRWRDLTWWKDQQALPPGPFPQGVRHIGHHNPHVDPERQISAIAGSQWWIAANDRPGWQHLCKLFIDAFDPPWASGNQLTLPGAPNLAPNRRQPHAANRRGPLLRASPRPRAITAT